MPMPVQDVPFPLAKTLLAHDDTIAVSPFDATSFATKQHKDPGMSTLMHYLDGSVPSSDKFILVSRCFDMLYGVLRRTNYSSESAQCLLINLSHLRKQVLMSLNDDSTAVHLGFLKTYERIGQRYFSPHLYYSVHK